MRALDEHSVYGRNYYARSPGGVWVSFDDLPGSVLDRLEARIAAGEVIDAYMVYQWERDGTTREEQAERWLGAPGGGCE